MLFVPTCALGLAVAAVLGLTSQSPFTHDWASLIGKVLVAMFVYLGLSLLLERHAYHQNAQRVWSYVRAR